VSLPLSTRLCGVEPVVVIMRGGAVCAFDFIVVEVFRPYVKHRQDVLVLAVFAEAFLRFTSLEQVINCPLSKFTLSLVVRLFFLALVLSKSC
jgi:hypothetical protein